jgi:hypothetical protein
MSVRLLLSVMVSIFLASVRLVSTRVSLEIEPPAEIRINRPFPPAIEGVSPFRESTAPLPLRTPQPYLVEPPFD